MSRRDTAWFAQEMVWKTRHDTTNEWVEYLPELPSWAPEGFVSAVKFIRIWANATSLNDVKKQLFWLSLDDLQSKKQKISVFLAEQGYQPLADLQVEDEVLLNEVQLEDLLEEGLIHKAEAGDVSEDSNQEEDSEDDREVYDPIQAMLNAEPHHQASERSLIQTMEVGGGFRFRAKH